MIFIALNAYLRKEGRYQVNVLIFYLKKLKKEEEIKSKVSRRKEIIEIEAEINELENRI